MKYLLFCIFIFIFHSTVFAETSIYTGEFTGTEVFNIKCTDHSLDNKGARNWNIINGEPEGNRYKAVIKTGGSTYNAVGTITKNTSIGVFEGKDASGNDCNGRFSSAINGNELRSVSRGSCPEINCNFTSNITATRQVNKK